MEAVLVDFLVRGSETPRHGAGEGHWKRVQLEDELYSKQQQQIGREKDPVERELEAKLILYDCVVLRRLHCSSDDVATTSVPHLHLHHINTVP